MKVGFIFSLTVPRTITHEKVLVECDKEFEEFIGAAHVLGEKLGPIVFQFPNFDKVFWARSETANNKFLTATDPHFHPGGIPTRLVQAVAAFRKNALKPLRPDG
jgi:uncharacterized protein YecE (DUF72 family)